MGSRSVIAQFRSTCKKCRNEPCVRARLECEITSNFAWFEFKSSSSTADASSVSVRSYAGNNVREIAAQAIWFEVKNRQRVRPKDLLPLV